MTDTDELTRIDTSNATKAELKSALEALLPQLKSLRDSVGRLLTQSNQSVIKRGSARPDDFVPAGWTDQHGISVPRADGIFQSPTAWVRVTHGVITGAGLKNQSILSLMVSLENPKGNPLVDEGQERSAKLYVDWKTAFLSSVDPVKWSAEEGRGAPEAWSKEDRYSKLLHRVEPDCLCAMDAIMAEKPKAKHLAAFDKSKPEFLKAFRRVVRAIREINEEADKALEDVNEGIA